MDCTNARILLLFARTGSSATACADLTPEDQASLRAHLEHCAECRAAAHKERQVDDLIGRSMRNVPVPAGLEHRILLRLAAERRPRPWVYAAAAAAALLIACLTGWSLYVPSADVPTDFVQVGLDRSPATVMSWFREQGLAAEAPPEFDFDYLDSWEIASVHGRRVPKLLFLHRGAAAHVYVVATDNLRVDNPTPDELGSGSLQSEVQEVPGFRFVVIYSSGSRESFPRRGA